MFVLQLRVLQVVIAEKDVRFQEQIQRHEEELLKVGTQEGTELQQVANPANLYTNPALLRLSRARMKFFVQIFLRNDRNGWLNMYYIPHILVKSLF